MAGAAGVQQTPKVDSQLMLLLHVCWMVVMILSAIALVAAETASVPFAGSLIFVAFGFAGVFVPLALWRITRARPDAPRLASFLGGWVPLAWFAGLLVGIALATAVREPDPVPQLVALQLMDGLAMVFLGAYLGRSSIEAFVPGVILILAVAGFWLTWIPSLLGLVAVASIGTGHAVAAFFHAGRPHLPRSP